MQADPPRGARQRSSELIPARVRPDRLVRQHTWRPPRPQLEANSALRALPAQLRDTAPAATASLRASRTQDLQILEGPSEGHPQASCANARASATSAASRLPALQGAALTASGNPINPTTRTTKARADFPIPMSWRKSGLHPDVKKIFRHPETHENRKRKFTPNSDDK